MVSSLAICLQQNIVVLGDQTAPLRVNDDSTDRFGDDCGADDLGSGLERIAFVDRRVVKATVEESLGSLGCDRSVGDHRMSLRGGFVCITDKFHTCGMHFNLTLWEYEPVELSMQPFEFRAVAAFGLRHRNGRILPDVPQVEQSSWRAHSV